MQLVAIIAAVIGQATAASAGKITCIRDLTAAGMQLEAARNDIDDASKNCLRYLLPASKQRCKENIENASTSLVAANAHVLKMNVDCEGSGILEACSGDFATFENTLHSAIDEVSGASSNCFSAGNSARSCFDSVLKASVDVVGTVKRFASVVDECEPPKARLLRGR